MSTILDQSVSVDVLFKTFGFVKNKLHMGLVRCSANKDDSFLFLQTGYSMQVLDMFIVTQTELNYTSLNAREEKT